MFKVAVCGIDGAGKTVLVEKLFTYYQTLGVITNTAKVNFYCKAACKQAELEDIKSIVRIGMAFDFVNYYRNYKTDCQLVLCDRFDVCYKVLNRVDALDEKLINQIDKLYSIIADADLYLYLDLPLNIATKRLDARGDRVDNESDSILKLMQQYYKSELCKKKRVAVIDASQSAEVVFENAKNLINKLLR